MIELKTPKEIEAMKPAGRFVGGILRDLLSRSIPAVLKKRIYAVASIAGAAVYYAMVCANLSNPLSMLGGMITTVIIRMLATHYLWDLPIVHHNE